MIDVAGTLESAEDGTAATGARIGVVTFPGTLDDVDAARAVRLAGAEPVSLWHGDADHIVPYSQGEHLARLLPASSLTTVPDLGHFAGFTQADEVLGGLRQVFDGVHPEVSPTMKVAT